MPPHDGAPAGQPTLPGDLTSETTYPKESREIALTVVSTSHRMRKVVTGQNSADIPSPRPHTGGGCAAPAGAHEDGARPSEKPGEKVVDGGRDPQDQRFFCA